MARKLKCETETVGMHKKIRSAFRWWSRIRFFECYFEHGQWWVIVTLPETTRTFSVVDACGGDSVDGFGFEEV